MFKERIQRGINFDKLDYKFACFANPSQDLFFDYEMFKWAYNDERCSKVKYCILGLNVYSFRYDLSRSKKGCTRSIYYYPYTKTMHHFASEEYFKDFYEKEGLKIKTLLKENDFEIMYKNRHKYCGSYKQNNTPRFNEKELTEEQHKTIVDEIKQLFNKPYEETLKENIMIFDTYLRFLKNNNIKTLVLIPPFPDIYKENISQIMRDETELIIKEFQKKYGFVYINLIECPDFKDEHFADWSHLNIYGADMMTEILNKKISTMI